MTRQGWWFVVVVMALVYVSLPGKNDNKILARSDMPIATGETPDVSASAKPAMRAGIPSPASAPPSPTPAEKSQDQNQSTARANNDHGDLLSRRIAGDSHFGCRPYELYDRIGGFALSDETAFKRLLMSSLVSGACVRWKDGEKVIRDEGGWASLCLRRPGEMECYWTDKEAAPR